MKLFSQSKRSFIHSNQTRNIPRLYEKATSTYIESYLSGHTAYFNSDAWYKGERKQKERKNVLWFEEGEGGIRTPKFTSVTTSNNWLT